MDNTNFIKNKAIQSFYNNTIKVKIYLICESDHKQNQFYITIKSNKFCHLKSHYKKEVNMLNIWISSTEEFLNLKFLYLSIKAPLT